MFRSKTAGKLPPKLTVIGPGVLAYPACEPAVGFGNKY